LDAAATDYKARWFPLRDAEEIAGHLSANRPVVAHVYSSEEDGWQQPSSDGRITARGGHYRFTEDCIVIVAADAAGYRFAGSWGPEWGDHGFGIMSRETANALVVETWAIEMVPNAARDARRFEEIVLEPASRMRKPL
jgi:hypothetical protein